MQLAGTTLDAAVAERMILDVEIAGVDLNANIDHLERSIGVSRTQLSPALHRLWVPESE